MKITKSYLRKIIREELQKELDEATASTLFKGFEKYNPEVDEEDEDAVALSGMDEREFTDDLEDYKDDKFAKELKKKPVNPENLPKEHPLDISQASSYFDGVPRSLRYKR